MLQIPGFNFNKEKWVEGKRLSGKKLSALILDRLKQKVSSLQQKPGLAALLVGNDPSSEIYVAHKSRKAKEIGFHSEIVRSPKDSTPEEIISRIHEWNSNKKIHGILIQLPLPSHINEDIVLQSILINKDADGFHYENMGRLLAKQEGTIACTPLGIAVMLNELNIEMAGKNALVLGRSNIVGKPLAQLLLDQFNCTVTVCHSKTKNIEGHISKADILISAMGKRGVVKPEYIKKNSIVIDVGIHRIDGRIYGDIDHEEIIEKVRYITPVPGGVGPMTVCMLLNNTYQNYLRLNET